MTVSFVSEFEVHEQIYAVISAQVVTYTLSMK